MQPGSWDVIHLLASQCSSSITAKTWHKNKSTNTRHIATFNSPVGDKNIWKLQTILKHSAVRRVFNGSVLLKPWQHLYFQSGKHNTFFFPCIQDAAYFCILLCVMGSFQLVGAMTLWEHGTMTSAMYEPIHSIVPALAPAPSYSPDIWQLISDIVSERPGPIADNCPTRTSSLYDTVQTLTIHTELYLSTYRRNPTVHFYLFSSSYQLISYWTSPWITISNRNNPRLVTLFLCRYFWLSQCRTILIISDSRLAGDHCQCNPRVLNSIIKLDFRPPSQ